MGVCCASRVNTNTKYSKHLQRCILEEEVFIDQDFLPDQLALLKDWQDQDPDIQLIISNWANYQWARISEVSQLTERPEGLQVFSRVIKPSDIVSGTLGDYYFLSTLSIIAERPEILKNILQSQAVVKQGIFAVNITKNGEHVHVVIDDHIPVERYTPVFSLSSNNDLWVFILEKAWAKLHGCYERIIIGQVHKTLRDLTGAPSWEVNSKDDSTWELIENGYMNKHILSAGINQKNAKEMSNLSNIGIDGRYNYSILAAAEVTDSKGLLVQILKLRNPYGSFQWQGDWSFQSDLWTEESKRKLNLQNENDGTFWIANEEFRQYFSKVQVCKYNSSYNFSNSSPFVVLGGNYLLVKMKINMAGNHIIGVSQKDESCFKKNSGYQYQNCRIIVLYIKNSNSLNQEVEFVKGGKFFKERDSYIEIEDLQVGNYYIFIDFDINEQTYVEKPPIYVNSYGPGLTVFFNDDSDVYQRELILEKAFRSKFTQEKDKCKKIDMTNKGAPRVVRYETNDSNEGYLYIIVDNQEEEKTFKEELTFITFQGLKLLPAWDPQQTTVSIKDKSYKIEAPPKSSTMILLRSDVQGYSMNQSITRSVINTPVASN